jgi:signal transduction histidine kinase
LTFEIDVPPPWVEILGDADKLARIVQNLVSNAVKFTSAGTIRVSARIEPDGGLTLSVRDTGRGIAPEAFAEIFDEFAQVGNVERDRTKGTGLGLAISQRLAKVLDGFITVQSEPGVGSEFTLSLPHG